MSTTYVYLTGGLGNQLFQYSAGLATKCEDIVLFSNLGSPRVDKFGAPDLFQFDLGSHASRSQKSNVFVKRISNLSLRLNLNRSRPDFLRCSIAQITGWAVSLWLRKKVHLNPGLGVGFSPFKKSISSRNNYLVGYFQSYKYSEDPVVFDKLMKLTIPNSENSADLSNLSRKLKPLVVHVRLGDYRNEKSFGMLGKKYYEDALNLHFNLRNYENIWLFSDEPAEAIELIPKSYRGITTVIEDGNLSPAHVLDVMRNGSGYIIANSTFSWWAAYLRKDQSGLVVHPTPWFKNARDPVFLHHPSWYGLDANFK
jgi:hypothetical protein